MTASSNDKAYSQDEFASAFQIAKEALQLVGQFQTPPTPDVYLVWYHYILGKNLGVGAFGKVKSNFRFNV